MAAGSTNIGLAVVTKPVAQSPFPSPREKLIEQVPVAGSLMAGLRPPAPTMIESSVASAPLPRLMSYTALSIDVTLIAVKSPPPAPRTSNAVMPLSVALATRSPCSVTAPRVLPMLTPKVWPMITLRLRLAPALGDREPWNTPIPVVEPVPAANREFPVTVAVMP